MRQCLRVLRVTVVCSAEGFDADDNNAPNPLLYTQLLEQTKTRHKQLGALGDKANQFIRDKKALMSEKGEKVPFVVQCSVSYLWPWQREKVQQPDKLAAELAAPQNGKPAETLIRGYMFSPKPRNLAPVPASAKASVCTPGTSAASLSLSSVCVPDAGLFLVRGCVSYCESEQTHTTTSCSARRSRYVSCSVELLCVSARLRRWPSRCR